jgi:hypothetical protein
MIIVAVQTNYVNKTFSAVNAVAILIIVSSAGAISSTTVPITVVVRMISVTHRALDHILDPGGCYFFDCQSAA